MDLELSWRCCNTVWRVNYLFVLPLNVYDKRTIRITNIIWLGSEVVVCVEINAGYSKLGTPRSGFQVFFW